MSVFWPFLRRLGRYRGLLGIAISAALVDAACAFGGFATLTWIIDQLFRSGVTVQDLLVEKLDRPVVRGWLGDPEPWIRDLVPAGRFAGFAFTLGIILVFALIGSVARYVHHMFAVTAVLRTVARIRLSVFHRLVHVPHELQLREGASEMISRVSRDCSALASGLELVTAKTLRQILVGVAVLGLALIFDWRLTLLFLLGVPVVAVLIRKFGKQIRRFTRRALRHNARMLGVLQEALQNHQIVKLFQGEGYERRRFNGILQGLLKQELRGQRFRALSPVAVELLGIAGISGISLVAAWYVFGAEERATSLLKVLGCLAMSASTLRPLASLNNRLQNAIAAADRVQEMLDMPTEGDGRRPPALAAHASSVAFDRVTYRYPGQQQPAVSEVSLEVPFGSTVAIVGPNGSGKSTLISLLPRLLEPESGRVLVDGTDVATVSRRSLRRQIAAVSQHAPLFGGTIADNIAYGRPGATREQVIAAAEAAHAHEFVRELAHGYDTVLAEGGEGLSGGQKQRIALARAMVREPRIFLLDEATSQVDAASEAKIAEALKAFRAGRTTFTIAHRLSTVIDADTIVVMQAGRVVAQGRHEELLATSELYHALAEHQLVGPGDGRSPAPARETQS